MVSNVTENNGKLIYFISITRDRFIKPVEINETFF